MLSQTAMYAIRALTFLAKSRDDKPVLAKTIAQEMNIPRNFLSKIMLRLVQEGFVSSSRGIKGGFTLAKRPRNIKLGDVAACFMDLSTFENCIFGKGQCDKACAMHKYWAPVQTAMNRLLDETTIELVR